MIRIEQRLRSMQMHDATLSLPIDKRIKSRLKVTLDDGREAGLFLSRGEILRGGDLLQSTEGLVIQVKAAAETVSTVHSDNALALARACYHLGNRHVPLQIAGSWVRYQHDHVLDDMVQGLGLVVTVEQAPFEPEAGAYKSGGHSHSHGHSHVHSHVHSHDHSHVHSHDHSHDHSHVHSHDHSHNDGHGHADGDAARHEHDHDLQHDRQHEHQHDHQHAQDTHLQHEH
jgi:urease accessory protein